MPAAVRRPLEHRLTPAVMQQRHPHHQTIAGTLGCEQCSRAFWEAQERLKRLGPVRYDRYGELPQST